jgi:hypothetical protein
VSPTFTHGKNAVVYQDDNDLTGYLRSVSSSAEVDTAESTTFSDDDKTYVVGMQDATISAEGLFDATFDGDVHSITGSGTKSIWSIYPSGDAAGSSGRGYNLDVTSAERTADVGDVVMVSIEGQSSVGTEQLISHHALAERSTSGTAAVYDNGASSSNGGYAYAHATAAAGSVVITIQSSSDNVTYTDYLTVGTITASNKSFRTTGTGTVNRYTRLTYTITSGTATFVCGFGRG